MSQSQTRRKGLAILQDEINDISRVVKNHTENLTRRLEKVKDMTSKYCGDLVKKSLVPAPAPLPVPAPVSSVPRPTVGSRALNTIPEADETNSLSLGPAPEMKLKSRGPVAWTTFRSKIADSQLADGSLLKTGEPATLKKVASLWEMAKTKGSIGDIEKYLVEELRVEPSVAAQKAPELEVIARGFAEKAKNKTRKVLPNSAPLSKKLTRTKKVPVPSGPEETIENWSKRMTNMGTTNYEAKTKKALDDYAQRAKSRALAATRLTPGKNRPGVTIPTLVPFENKTINGKAYKLNTAQGSLYTKLADGSIGEYVGEYNAGTGGIKNLSL